MVVFSVQVWLQVCLLPWRPRQGLARDLDLGLRGRLSIDFILADVSIVNVHL
jgi:hypothetical protein